MDKYRCILSLNVARRLLAEGFTLKGIETSKKRPGQLVFIFENSPELERQLEKYRK